MGFRRHQCRVTCCAALAGLLMACSGNAAYSAEPSPAAITRAGEQSSILALGGGYLSNRYRDHLIVVATAGTAATFASVLLALWQIRKTGKISQKTQLIKK